MEWSLMNPIGVSEAEIGFTVEGVYCVSDNCEDALLEILDLVSNDRSNGSVRQSLALQDIIRKDLIPLIVALEDDSPLFEYAVKLLALLTEPVEVSTQTSQSVESRYNKMQKKLLQQADEVCWNMEVLKKLQRETSLRLCRADGISFNAQDSEVINNCLIFLRNMFYFEQATSKTGITDFCLRMFFESGFQQVILRLLNHSERLLFTLSILQLLPFIFKDQLKNLKKSCSNQSSPASSRDGSLVDFNMTGQTESPSAMEEEARLPVIQQQYIAAIMDTIELRKPPEETMNSSKWLRNMGAVNREIVTHYVRVFLHQFLSEAFSKFVTDLLGIFLSPNGKKSDSSFLIWTLTFFLQVAKTECPSLTEISKCFDSKLISFLVHIAMECTEKLLYLQHHRQWCAQTNQKLHLTVLSIYHVLSIILTNEELAFSSIPLALQESICRMRQLRELFLLLVRHHQGHHQGMEFLQNVIYTNHHLLLLLEKWEAEKMSSSNFKMIDHIDQFATVEVMQKYGSVLENYDHNGASLNMCIMTMMHHVAGDCNQPKSLMQINIMKTFTDIWGDKEILLEDFSDLIEFVLEKFMEEARTDPYDSAQMLFGMGKEEDSMEEETSECQWSEEEQHILLTCILGLKDNDDIIHCLKQSLEENGINWTEQEIVDCIQQCGFLPDHVLRGTGLISSKKAQGEELRKMELVEELTSVPPQELTNFLVKKVNEIDNNQHATWLQDKLLQAADTKLCLMRNNMDMIGEPLYRISTILEKDIPIPLFTENQEKICHNIYFFALLNELGLKTPSASDQWLFPRIPFEWTHSTLLEKAKQLGPLPEGICESDEVEDLAFEFSHATTTDFTFPENDIKPSVDMKIPEKAWMACVQEVNKQQRAVSNTQSDTCMELT